MTETLEAIPEGVVLDQDNAKEIAYEEKPFRTMIASAKEQGYPQSTIDLLQQQAVAAAETAQVKIEEKTAEQTKEMETVLGLFASLNQEIKFNPTHDHALILKGKPEEMEPILGGSVSIETRKAFAGLVGAGETRRESDKILRADTNFPKISRVYTLTGNGANEQARNSETNIVEERYYYEAPKNQ